MKRLNFAHHLLYLKTKEFEEKYADSIPYFLIYVVPFKNKEELRRKRMDILSNDDYPLDDFKKARKVEVFDSDSKQNPKIIKGKVREEKTTYIETKITVPHGHLKGRERIKKEETYEFRSWNMYDCLETSFYGEMHELDELPDSNVVGVELMDDTLASIKVVNFHKKFKKRMAEAGAIGFQRTKSNDVGNLQELAVELTESKSLENPIIFTDLSDTDITMDEKTFRECFVPVDDVERMIADRTINAISNTRSAITQSFRLKGIEVVIDKSNNVSFQGGDSAISQVLRVLKERMSMGYEEEDPTEEQSGDEFDDDY
jgi:hypothetical protein